MVLIVVVDARALAPVTERQTVVLLHAEVLIGDIDDVVALVVAIRAELEVLYLAIAAVLGVTVAAQLHALANDKGLVAGRYASSRHTGGLYLVDKGVIPPPHIGVAQHGIVAVILLTQPLHDLVAVALVGCVADLNTTYLLVISVHIGQCPPAIVLCIRIAICQVLPHRTHALYQIYYILFTVSNLVSGTLCDRPEMCNFTLDTAIRLQQYTLLQFLVAGQRLALIKRSIKRASACVIFHRHAAGRSGCRNCFRLGNGKFFAAFNGLATCIVLAQIFKLLIQPVNVQRFLDHLCIILCIILPHQDKRIPVLVIQHDGTCILASLAIQGPVISIRRITAVPVKCIACRCGDCDCSDFLPRHFGFGHQFQYACLRLVCSPVITKCRCVNAIHFHLSDIGHTRFRVIEAFFYFDLIGKQPLGPILECLVLIPPYH